MYCISFSDLLSTSRGSKYVVDSKEDSNDIETEENKDDDLENNFKYSILIA